MVKIPQNVWILSIVQWFAWFCTCQPDRKTPQMHLNTVIFRVGCSLIDNVNNTFCCEYDMDLVVLFTSCWNMWSPGVFPVNAGFATKTYSKHNKLKRTKSRVSFRGFANIFVYKGLEADGNAGMVLLTKPGANWLQNRAFWWLTPVWCT